METNKKYIQRCIELAQNGLGKTSPNPLVGSLIVHNGKIIGEGWHQKAGKAHAEVNAINSVKNKSLLKTSTIYVNLEPCSHHGKTPPCSDLIIEKGFKKVVVGTLDPNPKVTGKGIQRMRDSGIEVEVGFCKAECQALNKRFFTAQNKKRPYLILKWAETADGFMAPLKQEIGKPFWITNPYSKQLVHKWRSEEQGILIGRKTAEKDNPQLNTRLWKGNHPTRILIDRQLKAYRNNSEMHLFDGTVKSIVFTEKKEENKKNLIFKTLDFNKNIFSQLMTELYEHQIQSVIIEGGRETLVTFIENDLWDEARIFIGNKSLGKGIKAPTLHRDLVQEINIQNDILKLLRNNRIT